MGTSDGIVLRLVPDRASILNSRERVPFILFVETLQVRSSGETISGDAAAQHGSGETVLPRDNPGDLGDTVACDTGNHCENQVSSMAPARLDLGQGMLSVQDGNDAAMPCSATLHCEGVAAKLP